MSVDDLYTLTPRELHNMLQGYSTHLREQNEASAQLHWEAHRWSATAFINTQTKKTVRPTDLIRFPWDSKRRRTAKPLSKERAIKMADRYRAAGVIDA